MTEDPANLSDLGTIGEDFVEYLATRSFFADFVARRPKYMRGDKEKELCDVFVLVDDITLFFEVKVPAAAITATKQHDQLRRWMVKHTAKAHKQISGALRALRKNFITEASNERRGTFRIDSARIQSHFGVVVVDGPQRPTTPENSEHAFEGHRCPTITVTIHELRIILEEANTISDFIDYLRLRTRILPRIVNDNWREVDLLATIRSSYPDLNEVDAVGGQVYIVTGCYDNFMRHPQKIARDESNKSSIYTDGIIDYLHHCRGHVEHEVVTNLGATIADDYAEIAAKLAKLRRVERRQIGRRIQGKIARCKADRKRHFFGHVSHDRIGLVVLVDDGARSERAIFLENLMVAFAWTCRDMNVTDIIGIAIDTPSCASGHSIDALRGVNMPTDDSSGEIAQMAKNLFGTMQQGKSNEFDSDIAKYAGAKLKKRRHFKSRKKHRR